jgi:hypothetical protein
MQKNSYRVVSWCAGVLLGLVASACVVEDEVPVEDEAPASRPSVNAPPSTQSGAAIARPGNIAVAENIDPCTALLGCIYTANQNGNDWLVPKCYEVLGPACGASLQQQ